MRLVLETLCYDNFVKHLPEKVIRPTKNAKRTRFVFFLSLLTVLTFYLLRFSSPVAAQQEFKTEYQTTYHVLPTGDAEVTQKISLTNNFSSIYATSYGLSLEGKKPQNVEASQDGEIIPTETEEKDQETQITVTFPDAVVGKGKSRTFRITYNVPQLAAQNGQVWELSVPRIATQENFDSYNLTLITPKKFGRVAYISPQPQTQEETATERFFTFTKDEIAKAGIVAAFGDFQVFSFQVTFHLQNPLTDRSGKTDIALIPDTAFQKVYYETLLPKPQRIYLDKDGNWLATYFLKPSQKLDIQSSGQVQIFSNPQTHYLQPPPGKVDNLSSAPYWETTDPTIQNLSKDLKTPQEIYDYVVQNLSYNYDRVGENAQRLGAKGALSSPKDAICMEFTDLFVTLARASGIPAREINGYAYTENTKLQPLSLVADVLHAWPEYWDKKLGIWKPIDPTWGNTTGGVDFFNKFDLSHITFAIHGESSQEPPAAGTYKLNGSQERDILVTFGQLPSIRESTPKIEIIPQRSLLPFIKSKVKVKLTNEGPVAFYNKDVQITGTGANIKNHTGKNIEFLAPFAEEEFVLTYSLPLFLNPQGSKITVQVGEFHTTYLIPQSRIQLLQVILILGFLLLIIIVGWGIAKLKKHGLKGFIKAGKRS